MHYINSTLPPLNVSKKLELFFLGIAKTHLLRLSCVFVPINEYGGIK